MKRVVELVGEEGGLRRFLQQEDPVLCHDVGRA